MLATLEFIQYWVCRKSLATMDLWHFMPGPAHSG